MAAKDNRTPQQNGSRPRISWAAALAYWLALPEDRRTYRAVADRFLISEARVGQVAKRDGWLKTLERIETEALVETEKEVRRRISRLARSRADRISSTLELFDRANDLALAQLPLTEAGEIDLDAIGDVALDKILERMPGLFRMAELAAGEATDRVHVSEVQPVLLAFARIALLDRGDERERILGMLTAASSGLVEIEGQAVRVG